MSPELQTTLITLGTIGIVSLVLFLVRSYVGERVKHEFSERLESFKKQLELSAASHSAAMSAMVARQSESHQATIEAAQKVWAQILDLNPQVLVLARLASMTPEQFQRHVENKNSRSQIVALDKELMSKTQALAKDIQVKSLFLGTQVTFTMTMSSVWLGSIGNSMRRCAESKDSTWWKSDNGLQELFDSVIKKGERLKLENDKHGLAGMMDADFASLWGSLSLKIGQQLSELIRGTEIATFTLDKALRLKPGAELE